MNKKIMVLWCIVVVGLLGVILLLGLKQKDLTYIKLEYNIKLAAHKYVKEHDINIKFNEPYNISIDRIINEKNIKSDLIDKYCIKSIKVSNGLIFDGYLLIKECEKENE